MTKDEIAKWLESLGLNNDPRYVNAIFSLLNAQWKEVDFLVWQFREERANNFASAYAGVNQLMKMLASRRGTALGKMKGKTIAYIAHPIGGDVTGNLADLRRIVAVINQKYQTVVPFVPYYADVVSGDDANPIDRLRGIANDHEIICRSFIDELWLTGKEISAGMKDEIALAKKLGIPVIDKIGQL